MIHYIVEEAWTWFRIEEIHVLICHYLDAIVEGHMDRLMLFMPPRAGKSQLCSRFFPAYYIGRRPDRQILHTSYAANLVEDLSGDIRDLIDSETHKELFDVKIAKDTNSKKHWKTLKRGKYHAKGVLGGLAGKGFNLGIIDDPISEQDAPSDVKRARVNNWYGPGFYTRRQPEENIILLVMTRWRYDDLAGHLEALEEDGGEFADHWEKLIIPAILDAKSAELLNSVAEETRDINQDIENRRALAEGRKPRRVKLRHFKPGDSFAPRRWPLKELLRSKVNMTEAEWAALYMQTPVQEGGNILKKHHWRLWEKRDKNDKLVLPNFEFIIQVYDTAFKEGQENDYSARTTWGVFVHEDTDGMQRYCLLLIERYNKRVSFPELRKEAIDAYKEYEPDIVIVEDKASGQSLIQELRLANVPLRTPKMDNDKVARAHAASIALEKGRIFYIDKEWSYEVINQCALFPNDKHDDMVDTCVHAWRWLRQTFWLVVPDEEDRDENGNLIEHGTAPDEIAPAYG